MKASPNTVIVKSHTGSLIDPKSVFNKLTPEQALTANLTGGQIQEILDSLILEAVKPIILGTEIFNLQISYLLTTTTKNKKRKLSALPREESISMMAQYLATSDREERTNLLAVMKLERGFIYNFVVKLLKEIEDYPGVYQRYLVETNKIKRANYDKQLTAIERSVGCDRDHMFHVINSATDYLAVAYEFRNSIVMNYLKHVFKQAHDYVKMKGQNFVLDDVYQNFLAAVTKAVDKYDSSKGALTSYINFWILNAKTTVNSSHGHEYNLAYLIPQLQKKALTDKNTSKSKKGQVNFAVSLDAKTGKDDDSSNDLKEYIAGEDSVEEQITKEEEIHELRALIKKADIRGVARLYLDIEETFSRKEYGLMLRDMGKNGLTNVLSSKEKMKMLEDTKGRLKQRKKNVNV